VDLRLLFAGLSFLIVLASGVWLTRAGKPYSGILLNAHKLIALAGVVLLALFVRRWVRSDPFTAIQLAVVVATGVLLVASIATGGLVSVDRPVSRAVLILHRVLPFVSLVAAVATLVLLLRSL
jgi:hypothetical protein